MTEVRWATQDDAEALADIHVTTWQEAYAGIFPDAFLAGLDRNSRKAWWQQFLGDGARVHVAEADGVVGFCTPGRSDEERWGEIFSIYVHPRAWGRGHGHALLMAGESTIISLGLDRALLWVLEDNPRARQFYERQGWASGRPIRLEEIGGVQVTEVRYEKYLTAGP